MTRKVNKIVKEASSAPGGGNGYCEMCHLHYDQLDVHVVSAQHCKLVTDPSQYTHLDSLIAHHNLGIGTIRKSLRIAKSPPPNVSPKMGGKQSSEVLPVSSNSNKNPSPFFASSLSPLKLNGHVTRLSTAKHVSLQPSVNLGTPVNINTINSKSCNGVELRSRKNPKDSKAFKDSSDDKVMKSKKLPTPSPPRPTPKQTSLIDHFLRPRKCNLQSPISEQSVSPPTPRPVPMLRPTPIIPKTTVASKQLKNSFPQKSPPLVSQPLKSTKGSSTSIQSPPKSTKISPVSSPPKLTKMPPPSSNLLSKNLKSPPSKFKTPPQLSPPTRRMARKRLSVEEKLIEDNKSYYKVEVLNSKLRSTEYFISQSKQVEEKVNGHADSCSSDAVSKSPQDKSVVVRFKKVRKSQLAVLSDEAESFMFRDPKKVEASSEINDAMDISINESDSEAKSKNLKTDKLSEDDDKSDSDDSQDDKQSSQLDDPTSNLHKIEFSFEMAPRKEVWMETYKRQEEGNEYYIPLYHTYPGAVLPFEMPRYQRTYKRKHSRCSKSQPSPVPVVFDDKPRKSPRCHASTLAIMSSLLSRRRPTRECTERPVNYDEESSLTETIESSTSGCSASSQRYNVPDFLLSSCDYYKGDALAEALLSGSKKIDIEPGTCLGVDPKCLIQANDYLTGAPGLNITFDTLLSTYSQCTALEIDDNTPPCHRYFNKVRHSNVDSCASSDGSDFFGFLDDGRIATKRKKRKRNLTGWPNDSKSRRRYIKGSITSLPMSEPMIAQNNDFPSPPKIVRRGRPPKNPLSRYILQSNALKASLNQSKSDIKSEELFSKKLKPSTFFSDRFK